MTARIMSATTVQSSWWERERESLFSITTNT